MRNSNFLTKPVRTFLKLLTNMCAYQINSNFVVRTWHNLKIGYFISSVSWEEVRCSYTQYQHEQLLDKQSGHKTVSHIANIYSIK